MYTVSRGPTRIITRTRRDISQKLENLEINREIRRKNSGGSDDSDQIIMSSPRPTFQTAQVIKGPRNGSSRHSSTSNSSSTSGGGGGATAGQHNFQDSTPPPSPNHVVIVKFFTETWAQVQQDLENQADDQCRVNGHDDRGVRNIQMYDEKEPHPALKDFKPFELEAWWGKRLYTKLVTEGS